MFFHVVEPHFVKRWELDQGRVLIHGEKRQRGGVPLRPMDWIAGAKLLPVKSAKRLLRKAAQVADDAPALFHRCGVNPRQPLVLGVEGDIGPGGIGGAVPLC